MTKQKRDNKGLEKAKSLRGYAQSILRIAKRDESLALDIIVLKLKELEALKEKIKKGGV